MSEILQEERSSSLAYAETYWKQVKNLCNNVAITDDQSYFIKLRMEY